MVDGSVQRRWNCMPAIVLLMEDGCIFRDSKQCTMKALTQAIFAGMGTVDSAAQNELK